MSSDIEDIPVCFAGLRKCASIPSWAKRFQSTSTTVKNLASSGPAPGIVVIHGTRQGELESLLESFTRDLPEVVRGTDLRRFVVELSEDPKPDAAELLRVLRLFPAPASRVDFAWGADRLEQSVIEAAAKFLIEKETDHAARPDPLAETKEVMEATRFLFGSSGRLSALAIAEAFGISAAKLGDLIGRSRQALAKTPDAPAIQGSLRPFERIARLRAVLSPKNFRAWLHRPNRQLDQAAPFDLIADGRVRIVAELVEDMLLGTPG
jgi:hypothetical protein